MIPRKRKPHDGPIGGRESRCPDRVRKFIESANRKNSAILDYEQRVALARLRYRRKFEV
jgi:hypothetical protein